MHFQAKIIRRTILHWWISARLNLVPCRFWRGEIVLPVTTCVYVWVCVCVQHSMHRWKPYEIDFLNLHFSRASHKTCAALKLMGNRYVCRYVERFQRWNYFNFWWHNCSFTLIRAECLYLHMDAAFFPLCSVNDFTPKSEERGRKKRVVGSSLTAVSGVRWASSRFSQSQCSIAMSFVHIQIVG